MRDFLEECKLRQLLKKGHRIIGFDNFFASSVDTIKIGDIINVVYKNDFYNQELFKPRK